MYLRRIHCKTLNKSIVYIYMHSNFCLWGEQRDEPNPLACILTYACCFNPLFCQKYFSTNAGLKFLSNVQSYTEIDLQM